MSPTQIIVIVLVVLVIVAALAVAARSLNSRRSLRNRFGPEYDRVVAEQDSRSAAERELRDRERRHAELTLTPLSPESRARYAAAWEELQVRFIDSPGETVGDADELVTRLIEEQGYPTGDFSDQIAHLSVEHARTLTNYRDAHEIHLRNSGARPTPRSCGRRSCTTAHSSPTCWARSRSATARPNSATTRTTTPRAAEEATHAPGRAAGEQRPPGGRPVRARAGTPGRRPGRPLRRP